MASLSRDVFYQTRTSLPAYDAARWLQPPPRVALIKTFQSGLKCVVQIGASALTEAVQEALVADRVDDSLLLFPDGTAAFDLYLSARPTQPKAQIGFAAMGADVRARWVARPTRARMVQVHIPAAMKEICGGLTFDGRYARVSGMMSRLVRDFAADLPDAAADELLLESWLHLLVRKASRVSQDRNVGGLAPWQVNRVIDLMESSLADKISLSELAAAAGLSVFHFARQFKRSTGEPPHAYLLRLRLETAARLLGASDASLSEVAASVGYSDARLFTRRFRDRFGATPGRYRREKRGG